MPTSGRDSLPHCLTASSHAAAAPGTVTVRAWKGGSAVPLIPRSLTASMVSDPGERPLPIKHLRTGRPIKQNYASRNAKRPSFRNISRPAPNPPNPPNKSRMCRLNRETGRIYVAQSMELAGFRPRGTCSSSPVSWPLSASGLTDKSKDLELKPKP